MSEEMILCPECGHRQLKPPPAPTGAPTIVPCERCGAELASGDQ